ncbi:hypothetical protein BH24CHL3_BH24CHL3_03460 [soil metagenome]
MPLQSSQGSSHSGIVMDHSLIAAIARRLNASAADLEVLSWREGRIVCRARLGHGFLVAKASTALGAFDEEATAMRVLMGSGVPVSDLVAVKSGPPALLVAAWANGTPITAWSESETLRTVGSILKRIHEMPATPSYSGAPTLREWISGWFNTVMSWWTSVDDRAVRVELNCTEWMRTIRSILSDRRGSQILFDGRPEHFIVDDTGNLRLIDVSDLQSGDPAMDLAVLELGAPGILTHVLEGYAPTNEESRSFGCLVPFYVLLRAVSAAEWHSRMLDDEEEARRFLDIAFATVSGHRQLSGPGS